MYRQRNPRNTPLYQLMEDHFDEFCREYEQRHEYRDGALRPIVQETVDKYLNCGLLENGFCRVYCDECRKDFLVAFSCKGRYFCPSCHQVRVIRWGDWVVNTLLEDVPHCQLVFSIPKILRNAFSRTRKLLGALSLCAAQTIKEVIGAVGENRAIQPGIIISIQTFGEYARWNPHLHVLTTNGGFDYDGIFHHLPEFPAEIMKHMFREKVFSMMMNAHFLHEHTAQKIRQWKHSGFAVYQSFPVDATDDDDRERLTQYIARAPISNRKLTYDQENDVVIYAAHKKPHAMPDTAVNLKDEVFDPVEFIYRLQKHIPDKGEVMIRYYGYYSNASRGKRNRDRGEKKVPVPMGEDFPARKELRKRWAALIQKVYEVDPLCCPRCGSTMRIIAYIDQWDVILRILKHLKLWPTPQRERVFFQAL